MAMAVAAVAAPPSDFYLSMLRRGVAAYEGGRLEEASRTLRIAAFGTVDSVEHYQTAQIHLALALDRLGDEAGAREAAVRVVAAQRIEARYQRLALAESVRTAFDALAKKVLTPAQLGLLTRTTTAPPADPAPTPAQTKPPPAQATNTPPRTVPETKPQPQAPKKPTTPTTNATSTPAPASKPAPAPAAKPVDVPARLAAADRALAGAQLAEAKKIYTELLRGTLQRAEALRVAEGLYRARDFAGALRAFALLGTLRTGEQPYHYYIAVARYETRDYSGARRALEAALPFIELTPDVARYRDKILAAAR